MMKKFLPLLVAASFCVTGFAAESKAPEAKPQAAPEVKAEAACGTEENKCPVSDEKRTACVDIGFWFDCPESTTDTDVEGVRFGVPMSAGKGSVKGLEWALFMAATDRIEGMQWTLIGSNLAQSVEGFQFSFFNLTAVEMSGVQLGLYNFSPKGGCQFGLINFSEGKADFQLGLLNYNAEARFPVTLLVNF